MYEIKNPKNILTKLSLLFFFNNKQLNIKLTCTILAIRMFDHALHQNNIIKRQHLRLYNNILR